MHALLDYWLCFGAKEDMQINPVYLDRWDFLVSELKKEGIYLHLVLFSFGLYTEDYSRAMSERTLHKLMMYLDGEWELEHFRFAADTIFRHVNPYTGVAWKDEPAIAFVEYYNEQSLGLGGRMLGLPKELVQRQPFPGPGLAIRVIGEITKEKLDILREADAILREEIAHSGKRADQFFAVLTNTRSVGVMGDDRTYNYVCALRAVRTNDFMTCEYARLPHALLAKISSRITNEVKGINRVVYDITDKPPATIEWE